MSSRRLGAITASAVAVASLLAGCSDGSSPPDGSPEPTESTASTDAALSASASAPVAESEPPAVAPGMKEITSAEGFTIQIPKTYKLSFQGFAGFNSRDTVDTYRELAVSGVRIYAGGTPLSTTLKNFYVDNAFLIMPKTLEPVMVAGVEMFHVAGKIDNVAWLEAFGVQTENFSYEIKFIFQARTTPPKERQAVVDSVLSTLELS